jgi:hypothetical protein
LVFFSGESTVPSSALANIDGSCLTSASSGMSPFYLSLNTTVVSFSLDAIVLVADPAFILSATVISIIHGVFYNLS